MNPALQTNSRFQGSKVAMLSGKAQGFAGAQGSTVAVFQDCKAAGFESSKVPEF